MFQASEPRKILENVIKEKTPAIMSYLSHRKWYVEKVCFRELGAHRLEAELLPSKKTHPINIQLEQPIGISVKQRKGKLVFDTKVLGLEPSGQGEGGGKVILAVPDGIEVVDRRKYFRVSVPEELKVTVLLWHRGCRRGADSLPEHYYEGRLVDISAGGAQVAIDSSSGPDLRDKQFIGLSFTPMPYEKPLQLNAQIRNIIPTADHTSICLGLQLVGLEASAQGHRTLSRLVGVVEGYHKKNQSGVKQQDFRSEHVQV